MSRPFGAATPSAFGGLESRSSPVDVTVEPALGHRNRLTCAFRPILAIPHILLVGGPIAFAASFGHRASEGPSAAWTTGGGVLGAVAVVVAIIAWFGIVFAGVFPAGLWEMSAFYLRWRVRAVAYMLLLRDEYPPFGDSDYPAFLRLSRPPADRNRVTVGFRIFLAIPQLLAVWLLSIGWAIASVIAWFAILFTGAYPPHLYHFSVGALRWTTRVEAYLLLLHDDYPPFSLN